MCNSHNHTVALTKMQNTGYEHVVGAKKHANLMVFSRNSKNTALANFAILHIIANKTGI